VSRSIATKEDVRDFADQCLLLRSEWAHFLMLFTGSKLKRELLEISAPKFFNDLYRLFVEHFVQHVCRLTDNAQTMGRRNLTVKFLIEHSDFSTAPGTLDELRRICEPIHSFRDLILEARNRYISHLDLETVRLGDPLGRASLGRWQQFWLDLEVFLDLMHRHHHVEPSGHFELNGVDTRSDAFGMLDALRHAMLYDAVMRDWEIGPRARRVADASKYAKDY
jgi:hypothetical protein